MCSNNFQNFTNLFNYGCYGMNNYTVNCNNFENINQINQYNNLLTSKKNSLNVGTLSNNSMLNTSKKVQNNFNPNLNSNFLVPISSNSNISLNSTIPRNDFLNYGINNILNEPSLIKQNETFLYPNHKYYYFDHNIHVPYFSTEMYNRVNFESIWSQKIDGSDLPCDDITTLRFFYNFGIHKFREIHGKNNDIENSSFQFPLINTDIKVEPNLTNSSKTTNRIMISNTPPDDNKKLGLLNCKELQKHLQTNQRIHSNSPVENLSFNHNQQLPKLDNYERTNTLSNEVTTKSLNCNILSDNQIMPHLEPQVFLNSFPLNDTTDSESKTPLTDIDNMIPNLQSFNSLSPPITLIDKKNSNLSKLCNDITINFEFKFNIEKNIQSYSKVTSVAITKKKVYFIDNTVDYNKVTINLTSTNETLKIINNSNENQFFYNNELKFEPLVCKKSININSQTKNTNKIIQIKDYSKYNLQSTISKPTKRRRKIDFTKDNSENNNSNCTENCLFSKKKLDLSPLKRSKFINFDPNNIISKYIKQLKNNNPLYDSDVNDSKSLNVITIFVEPKLLQALERLTLSYFNGKHYIIEKYNNTLQNAIDKIVSQELSGETLSSDMKNNNDCGESYSYDILEDNKKIRYIIITPDINNTLNQDTENISIEEKKKFEADVIKEALKKYLIKPVEIKKFPTQKVNIKAYVATPFFNTYLHYITNEYLNQIEQNFHTLNSLSKIVDTNISSNLNNSLQSQISNIVNSDILDVSMPINYDSINNFTNNNDINKAQNMEENFQSSKKTIEPKLGIPNMYQSPNTNNTSSQFSQKFFNIPMNSQSLFQNKANFKNLSTLYFNDFLKNFSNQQLIQHKEHLNSIRQLYSKILNGREE
ncbi:Hypothetical protein SRAE_1000080600 [Strongyloides ratti]|uniref:Uncharacterized protein n=1 Tax=Strongyloides ratti TaxID=34506 RepID=A0A090KYM1_STRRB|nr:Hypothetical protein SRAE_1000080600 [Strongyloides ratti]CEF62536.1 Hypothetical protein SRAE_1000080600 [Strongyloides ratti]